MLAGIVMAGGALVGLGSISTLAGVLRVLSVQCARVRVRRTAAEPGAAVSLVRPDRGKAMGFAYLGIGVGGALVPLLAYALTQAYGWHKALRCSAC